VAAGRLEPLQQASVVQQLHDLPAETTGLWISRICGRRSSTNGRTSARHSSPASIEAGRGGANDDYVGICHWHSQLPFPQVLASASEYAARPGSCRKPPSALYVGSGEGYGYPFPFSSAVPCASGCSRRMRSSSPSSARRLEARRVSVVRCCSNQDGDLSDDAERARRR